MIKVYFYLFRQNNLANKQLLGDKTYFTSIHHKDIVVVARIASKALLPW